mmetsp:Transcript_31513/g.70911  ORF Transcript_31513/g.70911 Transcript_31513/m.70911 type:complete len:186 (-) Transcript_31513:306-863(-)
MLRPFVFLLALAAASASDIVVLDSDNFDRLTKEGVWFIKFYAPWCVHCKRLAPVWEKLAKEMKGTPVRIGKVDADSDSELAEKFAIQHYPTLKIVDGNKITDYTGENNFEALHKYLHDYLQKNKSILSSNKQSGSANVISSLRDFAEKLASDSIGLYTTIVFFLGFFIGVLSGVLFAVREKDKIM